MSRMLSPSSGKAYGLARVCRIWRSARASVYRHRHPEPARQKPGSRRPDAGCGPAGTDPWRPLRQPLPWRRSPEGLARLLIGGIRTSLRRVLRLMRENDLLAPGRVGQPRGPRNHDGTIIPNTIDTLWGTDMTVT